MKTLAVIGCGALARVFSDAVHSRLADSCRIAGFLVRSPDKAHAVADPLGAAVCTALSELLALSPDLVVEFAGGAAVRQHARAVLASGTDLAVASVGALANAALLAELSETARAAGARLLIPCGAIGGLDALRIYALMGPCELTIENVKAPKSLLGAPYLKGRTLSQTDRETVFEGGVAQAIAGFPKNVNVAVAAALAAGNPAGATVRIVSDPGTTENTHRIRVRNARMHAELSFASSPDPANPRSSTSAALSVVALLESLVSPVGYF